VAILLNHIEVGQGRAKRLREAQRLSYNFKLLHVLYIGCCVIRMLQSGNYATLEFGMIDWSCDAPSGKLLILRILI